MLTYNSQLPQLPLPEYGRNIQQMVDHCVAIADDDERAACAESIVDAMQTLFPPVGDREEYRRKLWDHLFIMSRYRLNVESPYGPVDPKELEERPDPIPLPGNEHMGFRHYGVLVEGLAEEVCAMDDSPERDELVYLLASQMKKMMLALNRDGVDDARVFKDLRTLSHGLITVDPASMPLPEYQQLALPGKKKKKK